MRDLKQTSGRYVWLEMSEGQQDPRTGKEALGLSEIELLKNGTNVLAGVQPLLPAEEPDKLQHLTNGLTSSGIIMPYKEWLLKLHRRAMLEREKGRLAPTTTRLGRETATPDAVSKSYAADSTHRGPVDYIAHPQPPPAQPPETARKNRRQPARRGRG